MKLKTETSPQALQELMDMPYGKATQKLIEDGYWDWSKDPERRQYNVTVVGTVELEVYAGVEVWAKSADHALTQVQGMKVKDFDWDDDGWGPHDIDSWNPDEIQMIVTND